MLPVAEVLEGRPMAKENSGKLSAICTQRQGEALRGIPLVQKCCGGENT